MADRPILFQRPMVLAIMREIAQPGAGKTQTRRVLPQPTPPIRIGDRLYVREAWRAELRFDRTKPRDIPRGAPIFFEPFGGGAGKRRPPMFLPKWASRITLIVTDVRVQRLQEIEPDDCYAEGAKCDMSARTIIEHFRNIWDRINAERGFGWDANPLVAAYTFRPILGNIDQIGGADV